MPMDRGGDAVAADPMVRSEGGEGLEVYLKELLKKHSRLGVEYIGPDHVITRDCGLDSMALLETVLDLEEELGVAIPDEKMPELVELTCGEFVELVRRELEAAQSTS